MNSMQQQNPYEFLKWIPVTGEKHLGIAVIRFERRFILRFKVLPSEFGGLWVTTASMKTGIVNGKDRYDAAFELDSTYESEALRDFVIKQVEAQMRPQIQQQQSVFEPFVPTPSNNLSHPTQQPGFDFDGQETPF